MAAIAKIEEFFVCVFLSVLIVLVFFAAIFRTFGVSVAWSIDVAQMLFAWATFFGADLALHKHKHIGVDLLVRRFSVPVQRIILFVGYLVILCFLSIIIFYGTRLCILNYRRFLYTLPISYSYVTSAAPVGCVLMFFTIVSHIVNFFREGAFRGAVK